MCLGCQRGAMPAACACAFPPAPALPNTVCLSSLHVYMQGSACPLVHRQGQEQHHEEYRQLNCKLMLQTQLLHEMPRGNQRHCKAHEIIAQRSHYSNIVRLSDLYSYQANPIISTDLQAELGRLLGKVHGVALRLAPGDGPDLRPVGPLLSCLWRFCWDLAAQAITNDVVSSLSQR